MNPMPRPERIAVMRERMAEIGRAVSTFRDGLRESNDERHQAFFGPILNRIDLIVANERQGIVTVLADDIAVARSAVRRLRLPDMDPDLGEPTPARWRLRGERGNLVEALDNALETARVLGMEPRLAEFTDIQVDRRSFTAQLIRLDERLRAVQQAVSELRDVTSKSDEGRDRNGVSQQQLLNVHIQALTVEVGAARFETRIGTELGIPLHIDLTALTRTIDAMRDIADDLGRTVEGLSAWLSASVRAAGNLVAKAANRSWRGMQTVVRIVRRRLAGSAIATTGEESPLQERAFNRRLHRIGIDQIVVFIETLVGAPYHGRANLAAMASALNYQDWELLPLGETLQLLGFAVLEENDVSVTEEGRQFFTADSSSRKRLFRTAMIARVPLVRVIRQVLEERWNRRAAAVRFRDQLEDYMSPDYAEDTLRTVITWGRYAELFGYDNEAEQFSIDWLDDDWDLYPGIETSH
jgi:hypothetical protein